MEIHLDLEISLNSPVVEMDMLLDGDTKYIKIRLANRVWFTHESPSKPVMAEFRSAFYEQRPIDWRVLALEDMENV